MAWNVQITEVALNEQTDLDCLDLTLKFHHTDLREIFRTHRIYVGDLSGTAIADIKAQVQVLLDELNKAEDVKTTILANLNTDLV